VLLLDYASTSVGCSVDRPGYALGFAHNDLIRLLVECRSPSVTGLVGTNSVPAAGLKVAETRFANDVARSRARLAAAGYMPRTS
jgi:hypothetical protein